MSDYRTKNQKNLERQKGRVKINGEKREILHLNLKKNSAEIVIHIKQKSVWLIVP